jgi:hypothetical protein
MKIDEVKELDGSKGKFWIVKSAGAEYLCFVPEIADKTGQEVDVDVKDTKTGKKMIVFKGKETTGWKGTFNKGKSPEEQLQIMKMNVLTNATNLTIANANKSKEIDIEGQKMTLGMYFEFMLNLIKEK